MRSPYFRCSNKDSWAYTLIIPETGEEACHSVDSGHGCFCEKCFEERERQGLEKSPWEKENECEHKTEKCSKEFCSAAEQEEYKELYYNANPEKLEKEEYLKEAKEMVNCPFI